MMYKDKRLPPETKMPQDTRHRGPSLSTRALGGLSFEEAEKLRQPKPLSVPSTVTPTPEGKWTSKGHKDLVFDTQKEAVTWEQTRDLPREVSEKSRPRTLFQYAQTKSHCMLSTLSTQQGPHTLGYSAHTAGLFSTGGRIDLKAVATEQVMPPDKWVAVVKEQAEKSGLGDVFDGKTETSLRIQRAFRDYSGLYFELQRHLGVSGVEGDKQADIDPMDLIHELYALNPFTVYKWWAPEKVTKAERSGKGETSDLSDLERNFDPHSLDKFHDKKGFAEHIDNGLLLLDDDFTEAMDLSEGTTAPEMLELDKKLEHLDVPINRKEVMELLKEQKMPPREVEQRWKDKRDRRDERKKMRLGQKAKGVDRRFSGVHKPKDRLSDRVTRPEDKNKRLKLANKDK